MFEKYKKIINIYDHIDGIKYSNYIIAQMDIREKHIDKNINIINDFFLKR